MYIYYNHYILSVKNNSGIRFLIGNSMFGEEKFFFRFDSNQMKIMERLINGEGIKVEIIEKTLGSTNLNKLIKLNVFLNSMIDKNSIDSRSKAFYFNNNMFKVDDKIKEKTVLILGIGGIGTHVAWNLAVMNVGKLILVDHDVVELSNLNRQILYDSDDIGKNKTDALNDKLTKVSKTEIKVIKKLIDTKHKLETIISNEKPNLIIKSLDSPPMFPFWLDDLSLKYRTPYITGITLNGVPMIGPTYIPGVSCSYTDFFKDEDINYHFGGIGSSLGVIFYNISAEIALEAFKLLAEVGNLEYVDKVKMVDYITGKTAVIYPKQNKKLINETGIIHKTYILIAIISLISLIGYKYNNIMVTLINYINIIILPLFLFRSRKSTLQSIFVGSFVLCLLNVILAILNFNSLEFSVSFLQIIPTFSVLVGVVSIISCSLGNIGYSVKNKLLRRST